MTALSQQVLGLASAIRANGIAVLEHRPTPVGTIDTSKHSTMTIKIGDITVSGPASSMRRHLRIEAPAVQGWHVVIEGSEEPKVSYR